MASWANPDLEEPVALASPQAHADLYELIADFVADQDEADAVSEAA